MNKTAIITIAFAVLLCTAHPTVLFQVAAQSAGSAQEPIQAGHTHDIIEVKWSPDGERLISYSAGDGYIRVWDVKSARLLWSARTAFIQQMDERYTLTCFAWNPDQRLIASGSANGTIQVWDAQTGKLLWNVRAHAEDVGVVTFSAQGKYVASSGRSENEQSEVKLWDAISGSPIGRISGKFDQIIAIKFSADDGVMQTASASGEISKWSAPDGKLIEDSKANLCGGRPGSGRRVAYSSDLSVSAARCFEQFVITETKTGKIIRNIQTGFDHNATIVFSGDGKVVTTRVTGGLNLFHLGNGGISEVDAFHLGSAIDLNQDGSMLAEGGGWGDAAVRITEVSTGKSYRLLEGHPGIIRALVFSPDGSILASGSGDRVVRLWDPRVGSIVSSLPGHRRSIRALAFNPQGTLLVSSSQDQTMMVWDVKNGVLNRTIDVSDGIWGIHAIAFSPDGRDLVTAGDNASLKLWDTGAWKVARTLQSDENDKASDALSVVYSQDGRQILSGHQNGTVRLWDGRTGRPLRTIRSGAKDARAAFTPDGKMIVCANDDDSPIRIFDARAGRLIRTIGKSEDIGYVEGLAVSPDGKIVATSDVGGEISLWEIRTGKLVGKFDGGFSGGDAIAFSPDGRTLAAGGRNQNILLWETKSGGGLRWGLLPLPAKEGVKAAEEKAKRVAGLMAERAQRIRQANAEAATWEGKIRITFESYGEPINPMNARMMEPARPHQKPREQSAKTASGVWLRLRNDSPLPITFRTDSFYLNPGGKCGYTTSAGKFFAGLCDGTEVSVQYGIEDASGNPILWGVDFGSISMLPSGASVLFSVRRDHLENRRSIHIRYNYKKEGDKRSLEDYGSERRVYFKSSDLPR